jgi:hypothetical protein
MIQEPGQGMALCFGVIAVLKRKISSFLLSLPQTLCTCRRANQVPATLPHELGSENIKTSQFVKILSDSV